MYKDSVFFRTLTGLIGTLLISGVDSQFLPRPPKDDTSVPEIGNKPTDTGSSALPFDIRSLFPFNEISTENLILSGIDKTISDMFPSPSATGTSSSNSPPSSARNVPPRASFVPSRGSFVPSIGSFSPEITSFVPSRSSFVPSPSSGVESPASSSGASVPSSETVNSNVNSTKNNFNSVLPPFIENISSSLSKAVMTIPTVQKFMNIKIPGSEALTLFLNVTNNILKDYGKNIPGLPKLIPQVNNAQEFLTLPLFFQATGNALTKFLISQGIRLVPDFTQTYADTIQQAIEVANVTNAESLYKAIAEGYISFLKSLGIDIGANYDSIANILQNEIKAIQNYYYK